LLLLLLNFLLWAKSVDPDPHQSEKLDPMDPDLDSHKSEKVEALESHFGALEGPNQKKVSGRSGSASN
jgi:hypothetical protein